MVVAARGGLAVLRVLVASFLVGACGSSTDSAVQPAAAGSNASDGGSSRQSSGIFNAECHLDREFTTTDAACIARCAEQASCEVLIAAAAGVEGSVNNDYTWCADDCQCLAARNCTRQ